MNIESIVDNEELTLRGRCCEGQGLGLAERRMSAGAKFMQNLRAFRDSKMLNLRQEDSPETADHPEMDCSLQQCCQDMIAQGRLDKKYLKSAK